MSDVFDEAQFYASEPQTDLFEDVVSEEQAIEDNSIADPPIDDPIDDVQPEAPLDEGQGEVQDEQPAAPAGDPTPQVLDLNQFGDAMVPIKVNGEEQLIPLSELPNGYMRHADYTRKTQEVAEQRNALSADQQFWQQVDAAMKVDPQGTMQFLSQRYGVPAAQQAMVQQDDWGSYDEPQIDPQVQAIQQQMAPVIDWVSQQQAREQLDNVVSGLSRKYGDDFNADEVIGEALNRQIYDPNQLESVYRDMAFERMRAQVAAGQQFTQSQVNADQQAAAARERAVQHTTADRSAARAATPVQQPRRYASPLEAAKAAIAELEAQ